MSRLSDRVKKFEEQFEASGEGLGRGDAEEVLSEKDVDEIYRRLNELFDKVVKELPQEYPHHTKRKIALWMALDDLGYVVAGYCNEDGEITKILFKKPGWKKHFYCFVYPGEKLVRNEEGTQMPIELRD